MFIELLKSQMICSLIVLNRNIMAFSVHPKCCVIDLLQGSPKNRFNIRDNFGNSAPILTIPSLLQAEIYGA